MENKINRNRNTNKTAFFIKYIKFYGIASGSKLRKRLKFYIVFIHMCDIFNFSCCPHNLYDVPYIVSKPLVHKPQASI